jgi:hypothetical protein
MPRSRAPRIVAVIAALLVTAALFDGVASLSGLDSNDVQMQNGTTVVARADPTVAG